MVSSHLGFPGAVRDLSGRYLPRRPVLVGALVTATVTQPLLVAPDAIDFRTFQLGLFELVGFWFWDDPFGLVRFLGGIVGGYAAGYLTREGPMGSFVNGIRAVLLGVAIYYVASVAWSVLGVFAAGGLTGSILLILVLQPLMFVVVPMALLYTIEGVVAGPVGAVAATAVQERITTETGPDGLTGIEVSVFRSLAGAVLCVGLFLSVWGLLFYLTTDVFAY